MNGEKVCVYGTVYDILEPDQIATYIRFSSQPNSFFIFDTEYTYQDLKEGDCVLAEDVVQIYNNMIPYMSISDLYVCESWMK